MLSVAGEHLASHNPRARLVMYGQELNPESYAICKADMLIKGQDIANIIFGNTLSADGLSGKHFDYMLSNPPFGVGTKKIVVCTIQTFPWSGRRSKRKSARRPSSRASMDASVPACPASVTVPCCFCCT
jgi:type I restriction enzyme M protein